MYDRFSGFLGRRGSEGDAVPSSSLPDAPRGRGKATLKERDGSNIIPGPGSTRKPGPAFQKVPGEVS